MQAVPKAVDFPSVWRPHPPSTRLARSQVALDFGLPGRRDRRVRDEQRDDACWEEEHWPAVFGRPVAIRELQAGEVREAITCCIQRCAGSGMVGVALEKLQCLDSGLGQESGGDDGGNNSKP